MEDETEGRHLEDLLGVLRDHGGSDLHLKVGFPPHVRMDGQLRPLDQDPLAAAEVEALAAQLMNDDQRRRFEESNEADLSYRTPDGHRFRANVFRQLGHVGIVIRRVLPGTPGFEALRLPPVVRRLAEAPRGLVLVTGPTGAGKTTTCAAMIEHIARTRRCHIVTIEDPVEFVFPESTALIDQREVGIDTDSFSSALRQFTRQDPDVLFVGEIRDREVAEVVLQAAESGHLVLSTLHTSDTVDTIDRLIDMFPPTQQRQVRLSLARSLCGIISQRLVERRDRRGRVVAVETMVLTRRMANLIEAAVPADELREAVAEDAYEGMQTFDQHLVDLVSKGLVAFQAAEEAATNAHDFRVRTRHLRVDR